VELVRRHGGQLHVSPSILRARGRGATKPRRNGEGPDTPRGAVPPIAACHRPRLWSAHGHVAGFAAGSDSRFGLEHAKAPTSPGQIDARWTSGQVISSVAAAATSCGSSRTSTALPPNLVVGQGNGANAGSHVVGDLDPVVEAQDRDVVGDSQAGLLHSVIGAHGHPAVAAEDGGRWVL
jgi:hypothetical protein